MSYTTNQPINHGKKLETANGYFVKVFYNGICYFFFTGKDFKKINVWAKTLTSGDFPDFQEYNRLRNKVKLTETYLSGTELEQACRFAKFLCSDKYFGLSKEQKASVLVIFKQKTKRPISKTEQKASLPQKPSKEQKAAAKKVSPPKPEKQEGKVVKITSFIQLQEKLKDKFPEAAVANS